MSRKIDNDAAAALMEGRSFSGGNTLVYSPAPGVWAMAFYGSDIAKINRGRLAIRVPSDWNTPTTRARLNALPGVSVYNIGGKLYSDGQPWSGEWLDV